MVHSKDPEVNFSRLVDEVCKEMAVCNNPNVRKWARGLLDSLRDVGTTWSLRLAGVLSEAMAKGS